ncbi:alpha-E domain-containing protein [Qipengyuania sediminis]|uniref:alpha-E domain-containing protein n=1 Tax=Qipengyuania sediminis TaxID=1532023 RepID=UPI001059F933|nr:alpha-E domain-containing protein [Qipengyuania sediminis]
MLGRTANALFWMFRYLERVDNTARMVDAGLRMALTRDLVTSEEEWRSVIAAAGQRRQYERTHASYTGVQAWNFMLRERGNDASVLAMFGQVRDNARQARNVVTSEIWQAINDSWMQIRELLAKPVGEQRVGDVLAVIRQAGMLAHGAIIGTMPRDEGFHFARTGTFIERADNVARLLDIKYYLLLPSLSYVGSSLDTGQWDSILRAVSGDRAYRWLNNTRIDARGIVQFLIFDTRFPRSLAYCHNALRDHLTSIARIHGREGQSHALIREAAQTLEEIGLDGVFERGLHDFLLAFLAHNARVGDAIAADYRFLA